MTVAPAVLPHVKAVKEALETAGLIVYEGGAPPGPTPLPKTYTVLFPDPGRPEAASLADDRTTLVVLVQVTCVATTSDGAVGTADRVAAALAAPLVVGGRATWKPEHAGGPPVARDDDVTPPLYFQPVQFRLRSIPA